MVGGEPIYVVFCEACQTGSVKSRRVDDWVLTFKGLGGTLEEDDFIYQDLETQSSWHVVYGEALSGELKGKKLTEFDFELLTWQEWQEKYPNTLVLQISE